MQRSVSQLVRTARVGGAFAAVAAAALIIAGCSSAPTTTHSTVPSNDPLASLVAAAQKEGSLTIYGSPDEPGVDAALKQFQQQYDIHATYTRLAGTSLESRYASEKQSHATTADVIMLNLDQFVPDSLKSGIITSPADLKIPGYPWHFPAKFLLPDYGTAEVGVGVRGITINTNYVKPGQITTWSDLLKPKWKGHIGVPDPTSAAVYTGHWYTVAQHQKGGAQKFLEGVRAQLARTGVYAAGAPATSAAGSGEVWIVPMNIASLTNSAVQEGAPLSFVTPKDTVADQQVIFANSAPDHPNAAKLFIAYMMSRGGSQTMAKNNDELSPYDASKLPSTLWSWPISTAAEQQDNVNRWLTGR